MKKYYKLKASINFIISIVKVKKTKKSIYIFTIKLKGILARFYQKKNT